MQNREKDLYKWVKQQHFKNFTLTPLAGDASFRSYLRLQYADGSRIIMDALPEKEGLHSFLEIGKLLHSIGIRVPTVYAYNENYGFVILEDFGDELLVNHSTLNDLTTAFHLDAIGVIQRLQNCQLQKMTLKREDLPIFNKAFIFKELEIFLQWFLLKYLKLNLSAKDYIIIDDAFAWLAKEILKQPQVLIHRDFHSRNIMLLKTKANDLKQTTSLQTNNFELGIIDFQDAMLGPFTYDLVSLFRDCYVKLPTKQISYYLKFFYEQSMLTKQISFANFERAFDICGLQRHLKILGIFSRLYLRDSKPRYLQNIPLTLKYTLSCLEKYEDLRSFNQLMQNCTDFIGQV